MDRVFISPLGYMACVSKPKSFDFAFPQCICRRPLYCDWIRACNFSRQDDSML